MNKSKYSLIVLAIIFSMVNAAEIDTTVVLEEIEQIEQIEASSVVVQDTLTLIKKGNNAVLGVVLNNDMTFDVAKRKKWNKKYGALVSWVTNGSAAEEFGIHDGDIITSFDGQKVLYNEHLRKLIKNKNAGDKVKIILFRDAKYFQTEVVLNGEEKINKQVTISTDYSSRKHNNKNSQGIFNGHSGSGGINWEPMWYSPDWTDINNVAAKYGFSSFDKDLELNGENYPGVLLHTINIIPVDGGYGPQTIGGFYFSVGNRIEKINKIKGTGLEEKLSMKNSYWGVMIGKRIPIMNKILIVPKLKAGVWTTNLNLSRTWGDIGWNDIVENFDNPGTSNLILERKYYTATPSFEMIYKFTDGIGIHAGVSYMYGLEKYKGWKTNSEEFKNYDIENSPNTKLDGYIFTIGPWFFFD